MIFKNDKTYDLLSIISRIILPLSVLIASIGDIWNLPFMKEISLSLGAIDVFLGSILVNSKIKFDLMKEGESNDD